MITLKNVKDIDGNIVTRSFENSKSQVIDGQGKLTVLPALIAPFISLGQHSAVPNPDEWAKEAHLAVNSGFSTLLAAQGGLHTKDQVIAKKGAIDSQLEESKLPIRYSLYLDAVEGHHQEIGLSKKWIAGVRVALGNPEIESVITKEAALDRIFQVAAMENVIVAVEIFNNPEEDPAKTYREETAKAIAFARKYAAQLYLPHVVTKEQIEMIREAKKAEQLVWSSTTPQTLLHSPSQQSMLAAVRDQTLDMLETGAHELKEFLPILLKAYQEKKLTLSEIINLTQQNPNDIFNLERHGDFILVDLEKSLLAHTILKGHIF